MTADAMDGSWSGDITYQNIGITTS